ncbi:uncharacterized protein [Dermacentor andersoni]|uniref:uncharacterized protein n=1 Tax=Dermacentor andersoni TaxID=34620 RepID=UPI0021558A28|nr:proline-rich protein 2-like [Dermacentor andersoni]
MQLSGAGRQQFMEEHRASFDAVHPVNVTRQEAHTALRGRGRGRDSQHVMRPPVLVVQEREPVPQPGSGDEHWPHEWQQANRRGTGPIRRGRKALAQPTAVAGLPRQSQSWPSANGTLWTVPSANASIGSQAARSPTSTPGSPALQQSEGRLPVGDNAFASLLPCQLPPSSWLGGPTYPAPTPPPGPTPPPVPFCIAGDQPVQTANWNIPLSLPRETPPITAAPSGKQLYSSPNDSLLPQPSPRSSAPLTARGRKRGRPRRLSPPAQPARAPQASAGPPGGEEVNVARPARPAEPPLRPQELTPAPPRAEYPISPMSYHLHDVTEPDNFTEAEPFSEEMSLLLDDVIEVLGRDRQLSDASFQQ